MGSTYDSDSQILNNTVVYGAQGRWLAGNADFLRDAVPKHQWPITGGWGTHGYVWGEYNILEIGDTGAYYLEHFDHGFLTWWDGSEAYMSFEGVVKSITGGGSETLTVTLTAYNLTDDVLETGNSTISNTSLSDAADANIEDAGTVSYALALTDVSVGGARPAQGADTPVRAVYRVELQANNIGPGDGIVFHAASLFVYTIPADRSG